MPAVHMSDVVVVHGQESCPVYFTDLLTEGMLVILHATNAVLRCNTALNKTVGLCLFK